MKMKNRYYTSGHDILTGGWTHHTKAEAVMKAQKLLANDPHRDSVCIVQIIGIVRRVPVAVVVEKVTQG